MQKAQPPCYCFLHICHVCLCNKTAWVDVLCSNITEFGVAEDLLSRVGSGDLPPHQTKWYCIQNANQILFCFDILHFNSFISFQAKTYEKSGLGCILSLMLLCRNIPICNTSFIKTTLQNPCDVITTSHNDLWYPKMLEIQKSPSWVSVHYLGHSLVSIVQ